MSDESKEKVRTATLIEIEKGKEAKVIYDLPIDPEFDEAMIANMEDLGWQFWASGAGCGERDLCFKYEPEENRCPACRAKLDKQQAHICDASSHE